MIRSRGRRTLALPMATAALLAAMVAAPAHAEDGNWWYTALGVDKAAAAGFTGEGVKIAVLDGAINPDMPVFQGADLTISDLDVCGPAISTTSESEHGTSVLSLLIARPTDALPMRGMAPDASVTFYTDGGAVGPDGERTREGDACENPDPTGENGEYGRTAALNAAIDDGADIISMSSIGPGDDAGLEAIARATAKGIIIVGGIKNDISGFTGTFPYAMNGVVSVGSVDSQTELQVTPAGWVTRDSEVTVVAPGVRLSAMNPTTGTLEIGTGTSYATPLVAGALALAKQKYPDATANQLVQALTRSTIAAQRGHTERNENGFGYGAIDVEALLETDPTRLPDESLLMGKFSERPSAEQFAAAEREVAEASATPDTTSDVASDVPAASNDSPGPSLIPVFIGIGGAVLLIAIAAVIIIVIANRRRTTR